MSALGFEPKTFELKARCSTTELCTLTNYKIITNVNKKKKYN
jgi:hypothetical protein